MLRDSSRGRVKLGLEIELVRERLERRGWAVEEP